MRDGNGRGARRSFQEVLVVSDSPVRKPASTSYQGTVTNVFFKWYSSHVWKGVEREVPPGPFLLLFNMNYDMLVLIGEFKNNEN